MSDGKASKVLAEPIHWSRVRSNGRVYIDRRLLGSFGEVYYRYATVPEAIQLVSGSEISFSDPRVWSDKYEGHGMSQLFDEGEVFEKFSVFAKCFSSSHSSEALWRLFGSRQPVVRYGIRLHKLLKKLEGVSGLSGGNVYVAEVQYVSPSEVRRCIGAAKKEAKVTARSAVTSLFYKREAFNYESELRVVVVPKRKLSRRSSLTLGEFEARGLTRLLIDPYISGWQAEVFVDLFKNTLGFPGRVAQSSFDDDVPVT